MIYFKDRRIYQGEIETIKCNSDSDVLVCLTGQGKCKYPDGRVYEGGWMNNSLFGDGYITYPGGDPIKIENYIEPSCSKFLEYHIPNPSHPFNFDSKEIDPYP